MTNTLLTHDQQQEASFNQALEQFTKTLGEPQLSEAEKENIHNITTPPSNFPHNEQPQQLMPEFPVLNVEEENLNTIEDKPKRTKQQRWNEKSKLLVQAKKLLSETELEKEQYRLRALELEAQLKAQEEQTLLIKRQEAAAEAIEADQSNDSVAKVNAYDRLSRINHEIVQNHREQEYYDARLKEDQIQLQHNVAPQEDFEEQINPAAQNWIAQNPWYSKSPHLREKANQQMLNLEDELYLKGQDHLIGTPEYFAEIKRRMMDGMVQNDRNNPPNYYPQQSLQQPQVNDAQYNNSYGNQQLRQQPVQSFTAPTHQRTGHSGSSGKSNWIPELTDEQKMIAEGFPRYHPNGKPYTAEENHRVYAIALRDHFPDLIERQRRY